jgi:tetratricopeptide (TPR) repeat protein
MKILSSFVLAFAIVCLWPLTAEMNFAGASVSAAEEEAPKVKTRRVPSISEATYKKLAEAQEFMDLKDFAGAKEVVDDMIEKRFKRMNGNEKGQVYNMLGYIHFSQENFRSAINAYKQVLEQGEDISEGLEVTTLYTLAQLSFVEGQYNDALYYMETWLAQATNPGADPHIFMGQVYYQMKDFPNAISQIETGIDVAKAREQPVKENWWQLLNYLYFEQENWAKVIDILEILVEDFPKREYWVRLAGVLGQEGFEKEQLYTYEAAYAGGFLTRQQDLMNFAGLLIQAEVPYRAAMVIEKGFKEESIEDSDKTLQQLGQAWQLAQEVDKAIPAFESAAKLSDEGSIFDRLALLYLDNDEFVKCVEAADGALNKGGLRKKQSTYMVKGMCQYNRERLNDAREVFVSCRNESRRVEDDSTRRTCQQWITFIDREKVRKEKIAAAI